MPRKAHPHSRPTSIATPCVALMGLMGAEGQQGVAHHRFIHTTHKQALRAAQLVGGWNAWFCARVSAKQGGVGLLG